MKNPEIEELCDSIPAPEGEFFRRIQEGVFDKTLGFLISSLAGLFFLTFVIPLALTTLQHLQNLGHQNAGLLEALHKSFGPGGTLMICFAGLFFAGGIGLFSSARWASPLLQYSFCYLGLTMLYEIRYASVMLSATQGFVGGGFLGMAVFSIAVALFYYRRKLFGSLAALKVLSILAILVTAINLAVIAGFFWNIGPITGDRHVHYLSLTIFAVVLLQTYHLGKSFIPLYKRQS